MFNNLYLSRALFACFDGDADAAAAAAAAEAAAAAAAAAAAGGGTFTQEQLNKILADDRRKHQAKLQEVETKLAATLQSKTLTEADRKALEENLAAVQGQLRSKEQQLVLEKKQLEEGFQVKLDEAETKAKAWESRFRDSTIDRSLQDAAVKHEAFNAQQIVTLLRPWTRMIENVDEKTGKATGTYKPIVDFPDVDATTGEQVVTNRSPEEAVKRMKDLSDTYGNLFRPNVVSGIGSSSATGGLTPGANGRIDVRKLTPQQYREIREKNPELLGLRPKGRR